MIFFYGASTPVLAAGPTVIEVADKTEFEEAINQVNADPGNEYTIKLTADIQIGGASISPFCKATILGNGHTLTVGQNGSIHVEEGAQLTLGSEDGNRLDIRSVNAASNDEPGMLDVQGTCKMYQGVTLAGREGNNYFGGGVTVSGGEFHMYGGIIENCGIRGGSVCYGGGVAVVCGGRFVMDSGEIKDCYAESDYIAYGFDPTRCFTAMGGGVFVSWGSSFVMKGGVIANNRATNMGGGVAVVASYEEVFGGGVNLGNLQSSAEILGGRVEGNSAKHGAGVFASAYYYVYADAISASSPTVGLSPKQGLYLKNVQITDNKADGVDGFGGGVYTVMLNAPAAVQIEDTSITGNEAAKGGGIASYGYYTNMHVTGCTITGNTAKVYGGGFAATENTRGGKTTITNTVLCNNLANQAGADVYLSNAPLELPSASGMDSLYLGEPEDVRGNKIDGWYVDGESLRYMDQVKEEREEYTGYANIQASSDRICLIAAVKSPQAKITFTNEDGSTIKESWYPLGTAAKDIELPEAFKASDETYDYIFEAWSSAIEDVTKNAVYTAKFRRVFKKVKVHYTFHGTSSGRELPAEVLALLPGDTTDYPRDARIEAIAPGKTEVQVEGGTWIFKGFDKDSVLATMENVDDAGAVKFSGYWEFVAKEESIITPDKDKTDEPSSKTEKTDAPSLKSEEKVMEESPRTGDDSRIFLWLSLLLASGIAGITTAFVYCRRE